MIYEGLNNSLNDPEFRRIQVESSSRCNLSCPGCGRTKWIAEGNKPDIADMDMDHFRALVRPENKVDHLTYNLALSDPVYSGVFLEQLEYLNTLDKRPRVSLSTNGSGRSERWWVKLAGLLDQNTDRVEFAIDGLEDTNHLYRRNSDWDSIILGVKTLRANYTGKMLWRYVIFEHNCHQVLAARDLATELGFNRFRPVVGDGRTPKEMILRSRTWEEIQHDLS
jgi:sulfatase maturation enzyme AslB (radical SAM superfamily)